MTSDPRGVKTPIRLLPVVAVLGGLAAMAGFGMFVLFRDPEPRESTPTKRPDFASPKLTSSEFLNTGDDASYVGASSCVECHQEQFESYQLTAHSKALSKLDPSMEPPDAEFTHPRSRRRYRIYRKDDQLRQREWIGDDEGVIAEQDFAVDWLIGSGRHSRSYLVNIDDFLVESPVTWYTSRKTWDVSPGFDVSQHWGFERAADLGCLICHVGEAIPQDASPSKLLIREKAISCERCHGPGSLHVEKWRSKELAKAGEGGASGGHGDADDEPDWTIVNPARLDRMLGEDVCSQCHLRGDATVTVRGRDVSDYRPGLPLTDVRVDYHLRLENRPMKVVGHVEQMRESLCWKAEGSQLTCITCHDPHQDSRPEDKVAFYRNKCLECHTEQACLVPVSDPRRTSVQDGCATCHMPQVDTDIPHIAFTHHRIGIHDANAAEPKLALAAELEETSSAAQLSDLERQRCRGLAYLEFAEKQTKPAAATEYRDRAWQLLISVHEQGLLDGDTEAGLARILWEQESEQAVAAAHAALHAPSITTQARINVLFILADAAIKDGKHDQAVEPLVELTKLRRHSEDYLMLALCYAELKQFDKAIEQGQRAVEIHPFRPEVYDLLRKACIVAGRDEEADRYARLLNRLRAAREVPAD